MSVANEIIEMRPDRSWIIFIMAFALTIAIILAALYAYFRNWSFLIAPILATLIFLASVADWKRALAQKVVLDIERGTIVLENFRYAFLLARAPTPIEIKLNHIKPFFYEANSGLHLLYLRTSQGWFFIPWHFSNFSIAKKKIFEEAMPAVRISEWKIWLIVIAIAAAGSGVAAVLL